MLHARHILTASSVALAISAALVLASCAVFQRKAAPPPAPTSTLTPIPVAEPRLVYYAGVEGVKVYSEPSARSKVVGRLSLHEKVTRSKLERGYAYVESAKRDLQGWVTNAQLIWRLPSPPTTAAPAPQETPSEAIAPAGGEPQAPAAEVTPTATPVPPAAPKFKGTPGGVAPSIFNPY